MAYAFSQRFSTGCDFGPKGTFSNVWVHFWLSPLGQYYWYLLGQARDAIKYPIKPRTHTPKNYQDPKC